MDRFESLLAFNESLLDRHKRLRCFEMFTDGTFDDPAKREIFFGCLQAISRHFQTILFARQAHCADERYAALFRKHLHEEIGHDDVLRKDRGKAEEIWDPVLEGTAAWFISRMSVLDNIEKLALVHLVLESSGAHMGSISKERMKRYGNANYFGLHDEADPTHVTMALEPIRRQPPEALERLQVVIEQGWRMLDAQADRVAAIVLGSVIPTMVSPEHR